MGRIYFIRSDHPLVILKLKEVVFVSTIIKSSIGVKIINLSVCNECILSEVFLENCKGFIAVKCIARSPRKTMTKFKNFHHLRI